MYLCSLYRFPCMLSDSDLLIYMYLLDLGFTVIFLIYLMLFVISCTCMPRPHHLIMYTCACYACHLALFYVLAGVVNNLEFSCPDPRDGTVAALLYLISVVQRKRGLAVTNPDPPSFSLFLIGSRDSHLATREYFPVFHIKHPTFMLLSDIIFLRYCIMPCENCVLVLLF